MLNAYEHLVDYALADGLSISVAFGCKKSKDRNLIIEDIKASDDITITLWRETGEPMCDLQVGKALIIGDTEIDEHVSDHTDNPWFQKWWEKFTTDNAASMEV